jgi:hypothetical protein
LEGELGLAESGFSVADHIQRGDTLLVRWTPPEAIRKSIGLIVEHFVDNRLVLVDTLDPDNKLQAALRFSDFHSYDQHDLPMKITLSTHGRSDGLVEEVSFSNPLFDHEIPPEIESFAVPSDVEIREVQW